MSAAVLVPGMPGYVWKVPAASSGSELACRVVLRSEPDPSIEIGISSSAAQVCISSWAPFAFYDAATDTHRG